MQKMRIFAASKFSPAGGFPSFLIQMFEKGAISAFSIENHRKKRGKPDRSLHWMNPVVQNGIGLCSQRTSGNEPTISQQRTNQQRQQ